MIDFDMLNLRLSECDSDKTCWHGGRSRWSPTMMAHSPVPLSTAPGQPVDLVNQHNSIPEIVKAIALPDM